MKAKSFEDLKIWQQAREITNMVYLLTSRNKFRQDFILTDQMRRAAISVMANIAEGFERGGNAEFIQFLYIAKASCGELRSHLIIASDQRYLTDDEYLELKTKAFGLSAMISNMIAAIKSSGYKGSKYV